MYVSRPRQIHWGYTHSLCYELDDQVFNEVNALGVGILVVAEAKHHATQFLGEKPLSSAPCAHGEFRLFLVILGKLGSDFMLRESIIIYLLFFDCGHDWNSAN